MSPAEEDYLEMVARLLQGNQYVRTSRLAALLHVTPPSATKMVARLKAGGYVDVEPYDVIRLTAAGREWGRFLLRRHEVLGRFFRRINGSADELALVERIEHFIDRQTLENIERTLEGREKERENMQRI